MKAKAALLLTGNRLVCHHWVKKKDIDFSLKEHLYLIFNIQYYLLLIYLKNHIMKDMTGNQFRSSQWVTTQEVIFTLLVVQEKLPVSVKNGISISKSDNYNWEYFI